MAKKLIKKSAEEVKQNEIQEEVKQEEVKQEEVKQPVPKKRGRPPKVKEEVKEEEVKEEVQEEEVKEEVKEEKPAKSKLPRSVKTEEEDNKFPEVIEGKTIIYHRISSFDEGVLLEELKTGLFPIRLLIDEGNERPTELVPVYYLDEEIHCIDVTPKSKNRGSHIALTFGALDFENCKVCGLDFAAYLRKPKEEAAE